MARKHISQREAVRLRRRVRELEARYEGFGLLVDVSIPERLACTGMHIAATHEPEDEVLQRIKCQLGRRYNGNLIHDLISRGHKRSRDLVFEHEKWWIDRSLADSVFKELRYHGYKRLPVP